MHVPARQYHNCLIHNFVLFFDEFVAVLWQTEIEYQLISSLRWLFEINLIKVPMRTSMMVACIYYHAHNNIYT